MCTIALFQRVCYNRINKNVCLLSPMWKDSVMDVEEYKPQPIPNRETLKDICSDSVRPDDDVVKSFLGSRNLPKFCWNPRRRSTAVIPPRRAFRQRRTKTRLVL